MKRALVTLIMLLLLPVVGWATTYTVGSSGCDYTTARAAFDNEDLEPGDIVEIRADTPGGSRTETIKIVFGSDDYGSADDPIILRGRSGDTVTIDVGGNYDNCINTNGQSHIVIENLRLTGSTSYALRLNGSEDIEVRNCTIDSVSLASGYAIVNATTANNLNIHDCMISNCSGSYGLRWSGNNARIENNTFSDGHYSSAAIAIFPTSNSNSSDFTTIANNSFHNVNSSGSLVSDGHCIGLAGGTTDSRPIKHVGIYDNVMIGCGGDGSSGYRISLYNVEDVEVLRNHILNCNTPGIIISTNCKDITVGYNLIAGADFPSDSLGQSLGMIAIKQSTGGCAACTQLTNIEIANNTVCNNDDVNSPTYSRSGIQIYCANDSSFELSNITIKNNIISKNFESVGTNGRELSTNYGASATISNIVLDHNNYWRNSNTANFIVYDGTTYSMSQFATYQSTEGQDAHSFVSDPLLTSTYHLSSNSPCINAGTAISGFHETALDIDGQPILGTPDIGCDERKALWWDGRRWHMQRMYALASTPVPPSQAGYITFMDGAGINFKDTGGITFQDL